MKTRSGTVLVLTLIGVASAAPAHRSAPVQIETAKDFHGAVCTADDAAAVLPLVDPPDDALLPAGAPTCKRDAGQAFCSCLDRHGKEMELCSEGCSKDADRSRKGHTAESDVKRREMACVEACSEKIRNQIKACPHFDECQNACGQGIR